MMPPAMKPIFLPVMPDPEDPSDDPDAEPPSDEPEPEEPDEDPLDDPPEVVVFWRIVVELVKEMPGVLELELEPYTYPVVPEGADERSEHTTETDSTRATN